MSYREKKGIIMSRNKCKAGTDCVCNGMALADRFKYFEEDINDLQNGDVQKRKQVLNKAHPCLVQLICEIGLNILKGNLELPDHQYANLKPHKRTLLTLCQPGKTLKEKKKIIFRTLGNVLPKILPCVLAAVSSFAGHAFAKSAC
jgi:hypothetical protein